MMKIETELAVAARRAAQLRQACRRRDCRGFVWETAQGEEDLLSIVRVELMMCVQVLSLSADTDAHELIGSYEQVW